MLSPAALHFTVYRFFAALVKVYQAASWLVSKLSCCCKQLAFAALRSPAWRQSAGVSCVSIQSGTAEGSRQKSDRDIHPSARQSPHTGLTQYSAQQTAGFQKNASNRQVGIAMCVSCASRFRDAGTDKSNLVRNLCALHSSEESSYHWSSYGIKLRKKYSY